MNWKVCFYQESWGNPALGVELQQGPRLLGRGYGGNSWLETLGSKQHVIDRTKEAHMELNQEPI